MPDIVVQITDRPLRICPGDWPVIAYGEGRGLDGSPCSGDPQRLDSYRLTVRRHTDGRWILIYGRLDPPSDSDWTGSETRYGGVLLEHATSEALVKAIRDVGATCCLPHAIIMTCIGHLPPWSDRKE